MAILAASVEANGWVLRLNVSASLGNFASYALDPDVSPRLTLASNHTGFSAAGGQAVPATLARSLIGTKPLRQAVNLVSPLTFVIDETDLGGGIIRVRIALTEHVYATDSGLSLTVLAGWRTGEAAASGIAVTNNSTIIAPIPIMRWAIVPYGVTAGAFTLALFVASHHPVGFQPVAGVKFTVTDGTTVKTVWTTALATDNSYGDNLRCYTVSIDPATATALTAGLLRADAEVFPWLGSVRTTDAAGTRSMATLRTDGFSVDAASPWVIAYDPAGTRYGQQWAFVDPVNGTITASAAMVQSTLAGAKAVTPTSRPKDMTTALQAGFLANRTLTAANGQVAVARSIDGMRVVLATGTHGNGAGNTTVTAGTQAAEVPVRIIGDPDDANPRANCIVQTAASATLRTVARFQLQRFTLQMGTNSITNSSSLYTLCDEMTFTNKAGQETNTVSSFSAPPPAGQWNFALTRSRWFATGITISAANTKAGIVRNCAASRQIATVLFAVKNRSISALEDSFVTTATLAGAFFGAWGAATLPGQVEDIIIAWNDIRALRGRAWAPGVLPAVVAGTPNPSIRRNVFLGNVCERLGTDPQPFYSLGEDESRTMSYNIIEGNTCVGDRANTLYSDPFPITLADVNSQLNQAFVNRVANNALDRMATKHDDFNDPTALAVRTAAGGQPGNGCRPQMIGAWSMLYGVGHESNYDGRRAAGSINDFLLEHIGPRSARGDGSAATVAYVDDRSLLGSGSSGGNYRPLITSPLAARAVRGNSDVDADGAVRRVPFAGGAFQTVATSLVPAGARSTHSAQSTALRPTVMSHAARSGMTATATGVAWTTGITPAAGLLAQRGASPATGWTAVIVAAAGRLAHTATPAAIGWRAEIVAATAGSAHRAAATGLTLSIGLAPATTTLGLASTAPALTPQFLVTITPADARLPSRATTSLILGVATAVRATITVAADPRRIIPNRN